MLLKKDILSVSWRNIKCDLNMKNKSMSFVNSSTGLEKRDNCDVHIKRNLQKTNV